MHEQHYRTVFEHMPEGVAHCQMFFEEGKATDFIYLEVNPRFTLLTGLKDVVGKRGSAVIPGIRESDPELFEIFARVAATGKPEKFERFVQALQMQFEISVYRTKPGFFVAVFDVITERKQAEKELRDRETQLRLALDAARMGTWDWDIQTGRVVWSSGHEALWG